MKMFISQSTVHQSLAIAPVTLVNLFVGASYGWLAPTLRTYRGARGPFSLTTGDCSWLVSLQFIGRMLGCALAAATVDRCGRKALVSLTAILMTAAWASTSLTTVVRLHYLYRLAFGVCLGTANIATPIYVAEVSSPSIRGVFSSVCLVFFFSGQVAGSTLANICGYQKSSAILAAMSLVSVASVLLLREPAQHLLAKGLEAEAEAQFLWLRGDADAARQEFLETKAKARESSLTNFSFGFLLDRRVQIVCVVSTLLFLTGAPIISLLLSVILAPTKQLSANQLTVLGELAQLLAAIASPLVIDKFGRRTLWFVAAGLSLLLHSATAALFYARETGVPIAGYPWLLFGSVSAYLGVWSALINALSYAIRGELLPHKYKASGSATSQILNSTVGSFFGQIFLTIAAAFGMKTNFAVFAACSLALLVFCHFFVPETRGVPLVEIEKNFENSTKSKIQTTET